ncbi:sn1-specific diacylglycerol lipase alpha [Phtheirospermum japonicum]|uniref:Sn1-specific diacylglycerol lipase alpha n=1 Tax=Phtheirospermum japonicum TaxID=374723 RepID=A0A830C1V8_9LAMI|nr:sn1-specific diacylglycerol lipase alpha [Phtheirospermum japonicum]
MSVACCIPLVECVSCLACVRWAWKKFLYTAGRESDNWALATATEFEPIPRLCRYILSVYEDDLRNPIWAPPGGYGMNPDWVVLKKDYDDTEGKVTPYMIYIDHDNSDIIVAIRGLNLGKESDILLLLDNKLGQTTYDGGYVHNGLLKAAQYVLEEECGVLRELVEKNRDYSLTFVGHSLGAGVVTLLTMLAVKNTERLGCIERKRIKCFAIAPARCISLNLAVRYADVINSVVLQFPVLAVRNVLKRHVHARGEDASGSKALESERAFHSMLEKERITSIPPAQRMERQASLAKEHNEEYKAALERAIALYVPHAYSPPSYGTFQETEKGQNSSTGPED